MRVCLYWAMSFLILFPHQLLIAHSKISRPNFWQPTCDTHDGIHSWPQWVCLFKMNNNRNRVRDNEGLLNYTNTTVWPTLGRFPFNTKHYELFKKNNNVSGPVWSTDLETEPKWKLKKTITVRQYVTYWHQTCSTMHLFSRLFSFTLYGIHYRDKFLGWNDRLWQIDTLSVHPHAQLWVNESGGPWKRAKGGTACSGQFADNITIKRRRKGWETRWRSRVASTEHRGSVTFSARGRFACSLCQIYFQHTPT